MLRNKGLKVLGPSKRATRIESSKEFAKKLMIKYGVSTQPINDYLILMKPKTI